MAAVKAIPDGYPQVTPYLSVDGAAEAMEFYGRVLGATERMRMDGPDGKVGHAELEIGSGLVMLADEFPGTGQQSPRSLGGTSVTVSVYVEDVDAVFGRAIDAGATEVRPVADQFYGDRVGSFRDPWGHVWSIATHVEDVSPEEMARRAEAMAG